MTFDRISQLELPVCRFCHRLSNRQVVSFFAAISRLGNGWLWIAVLAALFVVDGAGALPATRHLLIVAAVCLTLYKLLKNKTARARPFDFSHDGFHIETLPLDRYSFPSGHTLHAVAFTFVLVPYYPALAWVLVPFTVLVAMSRLVLGLHYPTDVAAGAVLGALVALV